MRTFKSSIHISNKILYPILILFFSYIPIMAFLDENLGMTERIVLCIVFVVLSSIFIWMFFDTKYKVDNDFIKYNAGPFNGKINIQSIHKIEYHKGLYVPVLWRIALDIEGLIIYYNKFDDIYFSPENAEDFMKIILEINPNIEIKSNKTS